MPFTHYIHSLNRFGVIAVAVCLAGSSAAEAHFLDDPAALTNGIAVLRLSIGTNPRVLKIDVDPYAIEIQVQDPANKTHVDSWRYRSLRLGPVRLPPQVSRPTPVEPQLIDPSLDANLFDLNEVDFAATAALEQVAVKRAHMKDPAAITHIEIVRRLSILPKPTAGDVQWSLHLGTGRESAAIYANAKGTIIGADLSQTLYAKTVNLFADPELISDAMAAFRASIGAGAVLTKVEVQPDRVLFATNQSGSPLGKIMTGMASTQTYTWSINGLRQQMGDVNVAAMMHEKPPLAFGIEDIDWTLIGKLGADSLAKVADPKATLHEMRLETSTRHPGAPVLEWRLEIINSDGETWTVYADRTGSIGDVILPASRQQAKGPTNWLDPALMAGGLSKLGANFALDTKIVEIHFDERAGHVVIEDPSAGGALSSFSFTSSGVARDDMVMAFNRSSARLRIADLAALDAARLDALEQAAMKRLTARKKGYLNSLTIGANPFDPQAGAKAVDIYVRDLEVNSAQSNSAWALYTFEGKYLDGTSF